MISLWADEVLLLRLVALTTRITSVKMSGVPGDKHISLVWSPSLRANNPNYPDDKPVILVWSPSLRTNNPNYPDSKPVILV